MIISHDVILSLPIHNEAGMVNFHQTTKTYQFGKFGMAELKSFVEFVPGNRFNKSLAKKMQMQKSCNKTYRFGNFNLVPSWYQVPSFMNSQIMVLCTLSGVRQYTRLCTLLGMRQYVTFYILSRVGLYRTSIEWCE